MTEKSYSGNLFFLFLACILILGAFIFIKTTPSGIGLVSDSSIILTSSIDRRETDLS
jgi:hypothetical protein